MNIVIFGASNAGKHLVDELWKHKEKYHIVAILDNIVKGEYRELSIIKPDVFFKEDRKDNVFIITAGAQKTLRLMLNKCLDNGCKNVYMMHDIVGKNRLPVLDSEGEFISNRVRKIKFSDDKPTLHYFEVPITDNCNLNCKGCLFASNVICEEQHVPLEQIKYDAKRMAELFYDVPWIRILGGEPLLHPEIIEILEYYRRCFPESEIDLTTNGLLIPKMSDVFWKCIKENNISIHISGYKPTYKIIDRIEKKLKENNVLFVVLRRDEFLKYYTKNNCHDAKESYDNCIACACYEVYRGTIASCSGTIAFERFNRMYGMKYELREGIDWFNLSDNKLNAWEITKKLCSPLNICKYCDTKHAVSFEWEPSKGKGKIQDYII